MCAIFPFFITSAIVSLLAPIIGNVIFGVLTGTPQLIVSRDLAGVPFLLYGFHYAIPVVVPCAFGASLVATVFSFAIAQGRPFWFWVAAFSVLGLPLGLVCAAPMIIYCIRENEIGLACGWIITSAVCGIVGMVALSAVWYSFFRVDDRKS